MHVVTRALASDQCQARVPGLVVPPAIECVEPWSDWNHDRTVIAEPDGSVPAVVVRNPVARAVRLDALLSLSRLPCHVAHLLENRSARAVAGARLIMRYQ